jgi:hypothetical protein
MTRTQRIFGPADRDELLKSLAVARAGCVKALTKLPAERTVIKSGVECTMADIDEMAGLLTGNPEHFVGKRPSYG